jgi:LCP family protein required for cell wall assembly
MIICPIQDLEIMEQVQGSKSQVKRTPRSGWILGGLLILFLIVAGVTAFLTYTNVRDFVSAWNITDLPGIVVNPGADPIQNSPEVDAGIVAPPPPVSAPEPQAWDGASRVNILVMGLDYRDWISGEGAPRTDTMILFSIDPITRTAGILSIPRDLWVSLPGFQEPERINVAYRFGETYQLPGGGAELAMKTVEGLLGLKIDYYALVDFYSFENFIDELEFIEIDVPRNIWVDPIDGPTVKLKKGAHDLPGNLALAYARARNSEGGDFDRADRQQQVIMAVRDRILSAEMLPLLVGRAAAIYEQIASGVQTNLTLEQAIQLAWLAQQVPEENIKHGSIGTEHITFGKSPDGDDVLKPRPEQIRILRDEIFTASGPTSPAMIDADPLELMQFEDATVSVLNGAGTPGLATRTTEFLTAQTVNVVNTGDAPEQYSATTIISYSGNPYSLNYLVDLMNISPNRIYNRYDPASEVDFVIFLGYDWANNNTMP